MGMVQLELVVFSPHLHDQGLRLLLLVVHLLVVILIKISYNEEGMSFCFPLHENTIFVGNLGLQVDGYIVYSSHVSALSCIDKISL